MQDEIQKAVAEQLGIDGLGSDEQKEIIAQMTGVMLKAASIALLENLPEGKRDEFIAITDKQDEAGLKAFLAKELPDSENIVRAAIEGEVKRFNEYQQSLTATN